MLKLSCCRAHQ